jgi:hypothetical protein
LIEVHVAELKQLFNSIDPSPFRNRDLDSEAEDFIVGWAKDLPGNAPIALVMISTDRPPSDTSHLLYSNADMASVMICQSAGGPLLQSTNCPRPRFGSDESNE